MANEFCGAQTCPIFWAVHRIIRRLKLHGHCFSGSCPPENPDARDGQDTIIDADTNNHIVFGAGISAADLTGDWIVTLDGTRYLKLSVNGSDPAAGPNPDALFIKDGALGRMADYTFDDGSILTHADLLASLPPLTLSGSADADVMIGSAQADWLEGLAGADTLNAGDGDDTLDGGADNDTLAGGDGADTYLLGYGAGRDRVIEQAGQMSRIQLTDGLSIDDLNVRRDGDDLTLSIAGTQDGLTLAGYYTGTAGHWTISSDGAESGDSGTALDLLIAQAAANAASQDVFASARDDYRHAAQAMYVASLLSQGYARAQDGSYHRYQYTHNTSGGINTTDEAFASVIQWQTQTYGAEIVGSPWAIGGGYAAYSHLDSQTSTRTTYVSVPVFTPTTGSQALQMLSASDTASPSTDLQTALRKPGNQPYYVQVGSAGYQSLSLNKGYGNPGVEYVWQGDHIVGAWITPQLPRTLGGDVEYFNRPVLARSGQTPAAQSRTIANQTVTVSQRELVSELQAGDASSVIQATDGIVDAGAGDDTVVMRLGQWQNLPGALIYGNAGNDTILGSNAGETLIGGTGKDLLNGGWGSDRYLVENESAGDLIIDTGESAARGPISVEERMGSYLGYTVGSMADDSRDYGYHDDAIDFAQYYGPVHAIAVRMALGHCPI